MYYSLIIKIPTYKTIKLTFRTSIGSIQSNIKD